MVEHQIQANGYAFLKNIFFFGLDYGFEKNIRLLESPKFDLFRGKWWILVDFRLLTPVDFGQSIASMLWLNQLCIDFWYIEPQDHTIPYLNQTRSTMRDQKSGMVK